MTTPTRSPDLAQLTELHERAVQLREEAADAERATSLHWQETSGADKLARDEACATRTAWVAALTPSLWRPAGRACTTKASQHRINSQDRGTFMSLRRAKHAPKRPYPRPIGASGERCCGGESR
jgi:hypothetical protein